MANKFVSFEMVFFTGQQYMGNMCIEYPDITSDVDITTIEAYIKQKLNVGQETTGLIDVVTVTNWKAL